MFGWVSLGFVWMAMESGLSVLFFRRHRRHAGGKSGGKMVELSLFINISGGKAAFLYIFSSRQIYLFSAPHPHRIYPLCIFPISSKKISSSRRRHGVRHGFRQRRRRSFYQIIAFAASSIISFISHAYHRHSIVHSKKPKEKVCVLPPCRPNF